MVTISGAKASSSKQLVRNPLNPNNRKTYIEPEILQIPLHCGSVDAQKANSDPNFFHGPDLAANAIARSGSLKRNA